MAEKILGVLKENEKLELRDLFEKKGALEDLFSSLTKNDPSLTGETTEMLYKKIRDDMQTVRREISEWWTVTSASYGWEYQDTDSWKVEMSTGEVRLIQQ